MTAKEVYEVGRKRVAEMRQAQADRRAEVAAILRDYPQVKAHSEWRGKRLNEAYSLLFSLLLAGYFTDDNARKAVRAFLGKEDGDA